MNTSVQGIIVNNCQYAPIYLIQDPGTTQANTYVFTTNNVQQPKPITNNLKTFYENSGNIENGLVNVDVAIKPASAKKKEGILVGNNLKLASFLLPKNDNVNKHVVVDNVDVKSQMTLNMTTNNQLPVNVVPKIDMDRKIVKLKEIPIMNRTRTDKLLPKIKPKENLSSPTQSKYTAVQLLNVDGTYHSLNHLNKEQMKIVNHALKMFKEPDKVVPEPAQIHVNGARYLYKVVSPKDLTVVGQKKYVLKEKKVTKIPRRAMEDKVARHASLSEAEPEEPEMPAETKVTRSGRKVKLPKQILPEGSPQKWKKKTGTIVSCFQCSTEFGSLYRLQKHYENHPTHIPAKIHSNLFHCLLAIVKGGSDEDKSNIFIQQLEQLVLKLKSLVPCLLRQADQGRPCTIGDDVGRLFGMTPGKYSLDVDALNCVKDKDGFCVHNPPNRLNKDKASTPGTPNDETSSPDSESENCARINSVAKWPTVSKRIWKLKQKTHDATTKRMRLASTEGEALIDLGTEELLFHAQDHGQNASAAGDSAAEPLNTRHCEHAVGGPEGVPADDIALSELIKPKNTYVKFHSAHFDIRSSPIKSSSTVFRKFQIDPSKMTKYQVPAIRPLDLVDKDHNITLLANSNAPVSTCDNNVHANLSNSSNGYHETLANSNNCLDVPLHRSEDCINVTSSNSSSDLGTSLSVSVSDIQVNLHNPENGLGSSGELHVPLSGDDNSLDIALPHAENSLHDIFKDDVDLTCKDDSNIDSELKDWIISTSEKSQGNLQSYNKSSRSLIEPDFLQDRDKSVTHSIELPALEGADPRLSSTRGESVLNFLDHLSNDLSYPETEIRSGGVDFQLDLFTFHNSV